MADLSAMSGVRKRIHVCFAASLLLWRVVTLFSEKTGKRMASRTYTAIVVTEILEDGDGNSTKT